MNGKEGREEIQEGRKSGRPRSKEKRKILNMHA